MAWSPRVSRSFLLFRGGIHYALWWCGLLLCLCVSAHLQLPHPESKTQWQMRAAANSWATPVASGEVRRHPLPTRYFREWVRPGRAFAHCGFWLAIADLIGCANVQSIALGAAGTRAHSSSLCEEGKWQQHYAMGSTYVGSLFVAAPTTLHQNPKVLKGSKCWGTWSRTTELAGSLGGLGCQ